MNVTLTALDIKPDNVLISHLDTNAPSVKIGDLGSVHHDGEAYECQPFAMRAPEVWRGLACVHASEVWALAAMLLVWMKPGILGSSGINGYVTPQIWSIAKLMQLFPQWNGPPSDRDFCQGDFRIAAKLSTAPDLEQPGEKRVKVSTLEDEMQDLRIPPALRDVFRLMLNPEPEIRPSASRALCSVEYLALQKAALACAGCKE